MKLMAKPISRQELIDTMNENMTVERTKDDGTKHIVSSEQYLDESIAHIQSLGYLPNKKNSEPNITTKRSN